MDSDEENPRTSKFQSEREDLPPPPLPDPSRRAKPGKAQRQQRRQERTALDLQALGVVSSLDTADPRFHVLAAKALREPQIHLVKNVVEAIGAEATLGLLGRTKDIQEAGGVRVQEGGALKAAGGVFFSLVKEMVSPEVRKVIFQCDKNAKKLAKLDKRRLEGTQQREFELAPASVNLFPYR